MAKAAPYRCEVCRRNWGKATGEIMPAVWGTFCVRCLLTVGRMVAQLVKEARRG